MMKRHHAQMQNTNSNNAALGRCPVLAGAPSSMEGSSKGKQMEECSSSYGVERELASVGYAVKSSDLAQVAHRLEQLEMMLCTTQEDGISYLSSEAVHYNPSDLAGWVENMLSELNGGPPPDASSFSQSCGTSSNNMNMNMSMSMNMSRSFPQDHYDCGLGIYEAAAAAELGIDGSEFLFAGPGPGSFMMGGGLDDLLVPPSDLMMESVIQSSSNSTLDDHQTPKHEEKQSQIHQQQMQYQVKQETVIKEENLTPQTPKEEKPPRQQQQQRQVDNAADEKMRERKKMKMQVKTEPVVVPDRPMVVGPDDPQESGVRLVHTLMACAEAIQQEKLQLAGNMVKEIKIMASTQGGAMSKVARHFAEALARKIYGFLPQDTFLTQNDSLSDNLHFHFYETCPYLKFAHFTANQAILEAFNGHKTVHVIDFSLKQGMQWPALMQALALRPGGPPVIRLTAIGPPQEDGSDNMQEVGMKLTELARTINVKFQFHRYVTTSLRDIKPWMLNVPGFDAVAVNSIMQLHRLLIDPSGIDELLGVIRSLNPKIVTVVEQEANHNKPVFLERFTEALHYYSTLFDSLEARGLPALSEEQVMSEIYLGREICNIVACDREDRVERHEPLMLWRIRMIRAGFRAVHLGSNAFKQASMLLTLYPGGEGYRVEENNGCLTLGWHSRPLIAASAWQCT